MLSTVRIWGDCSTLVLASLKTARSTAPGSMVDQSFSFKWLMLERGMELPVVVDVEVVPVEVVPPVAVVPVPVVPVEVVPVEVVAVPVPVVTDWIMDRGEKLTGMLRPVEASAAGGGGVEAGLASLTMMSTTTSDLGLSRSWRIFSASAIW